MACQFGGGDPTPAPTSEEIEIVQEEATPQEEAPAEQSEPEKSGAVSNLRDAEQAVVRIVVQGAYEYAGYGSFESSGSGSGFIIDPSGIAVTNNHVVTGAALINVYFSGDPKPKRAKVLGYSECSDLAVIDIDGEGYPYFEWFTDPVELGLEVYSLGYPLGDPEFTQHKGNISKANADFPTNWAAVSSVVEHDAIINQGNSGGPLVTADGKVVGINYIVSTTYDQYFAITHNEAQPILDKLLESENVLAIGVNGEAFVTEDGTLSGIWIYSVASGSQADAAGIKPGDILLEMEGIALGKDGTMAEYCGILRGHDAADTLGVKVYRYKTDEILEGQLNGRELESTGVVGTGTTDDTTSPDETTTASGDYFKDEFDGDLSSLQQWVAAGDSTKDFAEGMDGRMKFELPSTETYAYVRNDAYTYSDVYVETQFEPISGGANGVAVLCRISEDGWYELRVHTRGQYSGSYEVYRYDYSMLSQKKNPYINLIVSDRIFSQDIITGYETNTIGMDCRGTELRVYINGVEQVKHSKLITDKTWQEGVVGIGVMSFSNGPIRVEFDYLGTAE
jgi:S1-C subfamily serine protease